MALTADKITALAARKGVRANAVQNFLGSLDGLTRSDAFANLSQDARSYKWNAATQSAISKGITEHFSK